MTSYAIQGASRHQCDDVYLVCMASFPIKQSIMLFLMQKSTKKQLVRSTVLPLKTTYHVQHTQLSEAAKYREKYRRLKRHVKEMIFVSKNAIFMLYLCVMRSYVQHF